MERSFFTLGCASRTGTSSTPCSLASKLQELNPILRGWANYYRHCAYAGRMFTSLDWYIGMRIARWLRKKRPKARSRDIWASCQPGGRRPTRRLWREGMVEQHMLAWTPVCRFRLAWMDTPDFAMSSGELGA
ncbi:group II intron maturase-specific domain-containing protein [Mesorhizobium abyssinicae]|uniref:group II intron maturase-specific domain-containing protein n=1 Tax=Mesorhizobium abyssinicae TaxID=1209958 RepID=UPI003394C6D4